MARKQINKRELCKKLNDNGFNFVRNNGHEIWRKNGQIAVVPHKLNYKIAIKLCNELELI